MAGNSFSHIPINVKPIKTKYRRIKTKLPRNWSIGNTKTLGIDPMFVETSTFGWLAKQRLENKKIDLKSSTGAIPSLTGEVFQA